MARSCRSCSLTHRGDSQRSREVRPEIPSPIFKLTKPRWGRAAEYARAASQAATIAERTQEIARAHVLLAQAAAAQGNEREAAEQLSKVEQDHEQLPALVRTVFEQLSVTLGRSVARRDTGCLAPRPIADARQRPLPFFATVRFGDLRENSEACLKGGKQRSVRDRRVVAKSSNFPAGWARTSAWRKISMHL
jgi:hypothetical protein